MMMLAQNFPVPIPRSSYRAEEAVERYGLKLEMVAGMEVARV